MDSLRMNTTSRRSFIATALAALGMGALVKRKAADPYVSFDSTKRFRVTLRWVGPAFITFAKGGCTASNRTNALVFYTDNYVTGDVTIKATEWDVSIHDQHWCLHYPPLSNAEVVTTRTIPGHIA